MKFIKFILIAILAMPVGVFAQGVIGPPYNPSQVMVYDGYYTAPVTVYSDKTTTVYIGDLTSNQAIVNILYYHHQSTVFMYFYDKQTGMMTSYMVSFWLDEKMIQSELIVPGQAGPTENYTFKNAPPILLASVLGTVCTVDKGVIARTAGYTCQGDAPPVDTTPVQPPNVIPQGRQPNMMDLKFGWYVDVIKRTVAQNWYSQLADPKASLGHSVIVTFIVHRDGTVSDRRIAKSSGVPSLDLSAIQAVDRISAFGPLPIGYPGNSAPVSYTFTYDQNTVH